MIKSRNHVFKVEEYDYAYELKSIQTKQREYDSEEDEWYDLELEDITIVSHKGKLVALLKYRIV